MTGWAPDLPPEDQQRLARLAVCLSLECGEIPVRFQIGTADALRLLDSQLALVRANVDGREEPAIVFSPDDLRGP